MYHSDVTGLSRESHKKIIVSCDFSSSKKCRGKYEQQFRDAEKYRKNNDGKDICLFCSRKLKFSGRGNPNKKYNFDDNLFNDIDNETKAYLLGWIASDGHVSITNTVKISIHNKDKGILYLIKENLKIDVKIKPEKFGYIYSLSFNSQKASEDICRLLSIVPGKKSYSVCFPELKNDDLKWAFIRGFFDGDGSVVKPTEKKRTPYCSISTSSKKMREYIMDFCKIPCTENGINLNWSGINCLDFLGKLYDGCSLALSRKRELYYDWACWQPTLIGKWGRDPLFSWQKTNKDAIAPFKERVSDSGFDLTLLSIHSRYSDVTLYDTGIKIKPAYGIYFDLVPRSSIIKTGYILGNSVGILDRSYTGTILVPLIKIDKKMPDLKLPNRCVQIIPRQIIHAECVWAEDIEETNRKDGSFGSTGNETEIVTRG